MKKRWTKVIAVSLFLLFSAGTILLPSFHMALCSDSHDSYAAAICPICQVANTPVMATASHTEPLSDSIVCANAILDTTSLLSVSLRNTVQARAPPVA